MWLKVRVGVEIRVNRVMLIMLRWVVFSVFFAAVNGDGTSEVAKPYKPEYTSGGVGSYSRGGLYSQSAVTSHHETGTEGCNMDELVCLAMVAQDRHGLEAIKALHKQLDDDADGNVDFSESDEFLREDLKYEDGYQRRQQAFHRNDDKHISVRELWDAWVRSEVHNWTVEQTTDWLASSVELPQYVPTFRQHLVTGATLPRLAVTNSQYLNVVLGIKDPIHKQKITLKAMDVVLFGPPKDYHHHTKDVVLVLLTLVVLFGFYYVHRQQKSSSRDMRRMMKDLESLHSAEVALEDLQKELEVAKKEQENVATEKQNLEKRLMEQNDSDPKLSYTDLEVSQLKAQVEMLRNELQRAEGELQDRCWVPPVELQHWLQITHEIENKSYIKKKQGAEKQLQQARDACEKLRKKRANLIGAFVSTHGKAVDDVDRSIVEARTSLNEVTSELQERVYRWKQMEAICGFNIINNSGLQNLEQLMYRGSASGRALRGRVSSSQDDLDEESLYSPSAGLDSWREDSSGSEQGKIEIEDEAQADTRSVASSVQFTVGGDWADDVPPIPVVPKRTHKSSMVRSYSQDTNVNTIMIDRDRNRDKDRERDVSLNQSKLSQSETNLEAQVAVRQAPTKGLVRDASMEVEDVVRPVRRSVVSASSLSSRDDDELASSQPSRRVLRDVPRHDDDVSAFRRAVRDWEVPEEERVYRKIREATEDMKRPVRESASFDDFRRSRDDFRKMVRDPSEDNVRRLTRLKENAGGPDDDTHSTDSNSAATDESEARRRKRKLFGHFRKDRSKPS